MLLTINYLIITDTFIYFTKQVYLLTVTPSYRLKPYIINHHEQFEIMYVYTLFFTENVKITSFFSNFLLQLKVEMVDYFVPGVRSEFRKVKMKEYPIRKFF